MKYVFCMFLMGCSGDTFMSEIRPAIFIDSGIESIEDAETDRSVDTVESGSSPESSIERHFVGSAFGAGSSFL